MTKIEEGEDKQMQLPLLAHLLKQQMQQQLQQAKEERRARANPKKEEKERRGLCVRTTSLTRVVLREINALILTPERQESGATGHDLAACKRPARDSRHKGSPPQ